MLCFKILVVPCLHQLVEIAIHVLHANVQLLAEWIEENVQGGDNVSVVRKCAKKDDFSKLQAGCKRLECFLHRFDSNLLL